MAYALAGNPFERQPVGDQLREWREKRHLSQLKLAEVAGISTRHLSFIETGRSAPSRDMVLRLAEHLDIPLRDRNDLLLAAGYAPFYSENPLDSPELSAVRSALRRLLTGHDPLPAVVVDRQWNLVEANAGFEIFTNGIPQWLLEPPVNTLRLAFHPDGVSQRILNLAEWRSHVLGRLRRRIELTADDGLARLYEELCGYADDEDADFARSGILVPMRLACGDHEIALFCTQIIFGSPLDVTVAELVIEAFFPADEKSADILLGTR